MKRNINYWKIAGLLALLVALASAMIGVLSYK